MPENQPRGLGGLPSGLHLALDNLGRTRGSSATPAIESPAPSRSWQQEISSLSNREYHTVSSNAFGFEPQLPANFMSFPGFGTNSNVAWQAQPTNTMVSNNFPQNHSHQRSRRPSEGHKSSSSASASVQVPPAAFCAPSTTRQGVTKNLPATAPLPSSSTFPPFNQQQQGSNNMSSQTLSGPHASPNINQDFGSTEISRRLHELQKCISSTTSIPCHVQEHMSSEVRHISQKHNEFQQLMIKEFDRVSFERDSLGEQLLEMNHDFMDMMNLREKAVLHGDGLRKRISDIGMHHRLSKERLVEMKDTVTNWNRQLCQELDEKEKALEQCRAELIAVSSKHSNQQPFSEGNLYTTPPGERSLQNGVPSRLSSNHAPPVWPSKPPKTPTSPSNNTSSRQRINQHPPANRVASNASQRPNLPTGRGSSAGTLTLLNQPNFSDRPRITTEAGTDSSMALVLAGENFEHQFPIFEEKLTKLFNLMGGWVEKYANIPNPDNDRIIAQTNAPLWDYMLGLTYPTQRPEAHKHTTMLLNSRRDRRYFIMRMMAEYMVKDILNVAAFKPASEKTKQIIDYVKQKHESERGMTKERRQELLDQQLYAVREIVEGPGYRKYRNEQLEHHGKKLRKMLGGLLNNNVVRSSAGTDLGAIATFAWDLSAKMNTAHFTFVTAFFETTSKFSAATMTTKDTLSRDPMQLQLSGARLKLVITPNITIRDDRGASIKVKNLHKSNVLVQ
ncbi:hypothetical protein BP6252_06133 [Coleophoma cylindrospora]|uniref:Uncharacterized protein n=1 Tax=Coleophoma cylindrospora TaxID=1849047 RepID=A0A3D8RMG9_9HELO|nr:hypothetical protein BP6252_06133 [Coleophoma cylindrospora]